MYSSDIIYDEIRNVRTESHMEMTLIPFGLIKKQSNRYGLIPIQAEKFILKKPFDH